MTSPVSRRPATLRLALGGAFVALATLTAQAEETRPTPQSPDILLGPLFNDVQSAKLFSDQKTFADAIPNGDPLMILADYRMQKNQTSFDLRHFVELNFTPASGKRPVRSAKRANPAPAYQWTLASADPQYR